MGSEFIIWILLSFLLNYFLKKKFTSFVEFGTPKKLFLLTLIFFSVHQITASFLKTREVVFFVFSLLSFGLFLISFFEKRGKIKENVFIKDKKDFQRSTNERAQIKYIASQAQLYRLKKEDNNQRFYKA